MRAGWSSELAIECRRPDSRVRTFIDAEIELASDIRRRRAQWQLADGVVLRAHDFPASSSLTAAGQTTDLTLSAAPAGNALYEVHWSVRLSPIVPAANANAHAVVVVIETRPAAGSWTERASFRYDVVRTAGQTSTPVLWLHEAELIRVTGLTATSELRLRVKSASGPSGWSFSVHGFNLATNADPLAGVTYHTGLAVDFPADGGVALADTAITKVENTVSDGFMTDLGGPPLFAGAAPFFVALFGWSGTGSPDPPEMPFDRIVAYLNPRVDAGQPKNVAFWRCQPYLTRPRDGSGRLDVHAPTGTLQQVAAQDGDAPEDISFSWATLSDAQKPRPQMGSYITAVYIWAVQLDGSPATNVGWGQDSATSTVDSGPRRLRTGRVDRSGTLWFLTAPSLPVLRVRFEAGNYPASATVAFTGSGAGSRFDLGAPPTRTVQFIARADVPAGASALFQVRNDADSAWVTVLDGQTTDDLAGVSKQQTRKAQVILGATPGLDATPVVAEFGMRELDIYPLHNNARLEAARWSVDPLQLLSETTSARVVALRNDIMTEFQDRITRLLADYFIGQLTLRVWAGTPERPRWLHIDDFLIDDEELRGAEAGLSCLGVTALERGTLPPFDAASQSVEPLVYQNKSLKFVYDDIMAKAGVSGRFLGPGIEDAATLVSKTLTEAQAKEELDALCFLDGSARISSQGRIKAARIFGPKAVVRLFSRESIKWASVTPGYRQRQPEVRIPWNWSEEEQRFRDEHKAVHGTALLRLGRARVDPPQLLPEAVSRYIHSASLAERVGLRHVGAVGAGLMVWFFQTEYQEPQLEPGDCVAVPTSLFVARDPISDRPLDGELWTLGVLVATSEDFRTFALFVRSYADILGGTDAGVRLFNAAVTVEFVWRGDRLLVAWVGTSSVASVRVAVDGISQPEAGTGAVFDGQTGEAQVQGAPNRWNQRPALFVTVTPYTRAGAGGVQGAPVFLRSAIPVIYLLDPNVARLVGQERTLGQVVTYLVPNGDFDIWNPQPEAFT